MMQTARGRRGLLSKSVALFMIALFSRPCGAADAEALDRPLEKFEARGGNAFIDVCRVTNTPCGVEEVRANEIAAKFKGKRQQHNNATPRKILNSIASQIPDYRWAMRSGVLNLEPKTREGEDVLARKLESVSIHGVTSFKAALDVLSQANIKTGYQTPGKVRLAFVDLDLKNVTVREALNEIVKADGQAAWLLTNGAMGRDFMMLTWREAGATSIHERRTGKGSKTP